MKAIEFIAQKNRDKMIEIPAEHVNALSGSFRVIILLDQDEVKPKVAKKKRPEFKAVKLKTKGFKFNREELYDE